MDMLMLSICNSRERDREDWQKVISEADPRFKIRSVFTPSESALGIIVAVWEP
jgi:hypothetical protein